MHTQAIIALIAAPALIHGAVLPQPSQPTAHAAPAAATAEPSFDDVASAQAAAAPTPTPAAKMSPEAELLARGENPANWKNPNSPYTRWNPDAWAVPINSGGKKVDSKYGHAPQTAYSGCRMM